MNMQSGNKDKDINTSMDCLAETLKTLREDRKWTQKELAKKLGVDRRTLKNYEEGISFPPADIILRYTRIFGVSLEYIYYGKKVGNQELYDKLQALSDKRRTAVMGVIESYD